MEKIQVYIVALLLLASSAFGDDFQVTLRPAAASDDCGCATDTWGLNDNMCYVGEYGHDGITKQGWRFVNVTIPKDATITSAYLWYISALSDGDNPTIHMWAEDTADAVTFSDETDFDARTKTTATIVQTVWDAQTSGTWYKFGNSDIKSLVHEVVNRGDWSSGNDLVLLSIGDIGDGNNELVRMYMYDQTSDYACSLAVTYTVPGSKIFSNSTDIKDTYIYSDDPTTNFSSDTGMMVANALAIYYASALFTLETSAWDSIGEGQFITACSAYAYCFNNSFFNTVYSAAIKRPMVVTQATYNIYSTGNNWGTAGAQGAADKGDNYDVETIADNTLYKFALDTTELNAAYNGDSTYRGMLQWGAGNLLVWFNSVDAAADHRFAIVLYYEALSTGPVNYRHGPDGVGQRHGPDGVSARSSP